MTLEDTCIILSGVSLQLNPGPQHLLYLDEQFEVPTTLAIPFPTEKHAAAEGEINEERQWWRFSK